ncbi:MAG TPA: glycoside hydrolase family 43 protein [Verrucomicrobiae bacterium]|jgi:GH43 family beta-xylosidase
MLESEGFRPDNLVMRNRGRIILFGILLLLSGRFAVRAEAGTDRRFVNPVAAHGQDPWVIRWQTNYFLCQSRGNAVWVNRAAKLEDIGTNQWKCIWRAPRGGDYSKEIWAPELHLIQGKWYVYVAADNGDNANHRMYVLEGTSADPQAPFIFKGKISAPDDHWAIDGTVLEMPDGKLYFIWSGWPDDKDGVQNLYLAPMSNPWTISGERVCLSQPRYAWESGDGHRINEGPETLWHDGKLFVVYSANGFWNDNYCLGQLTWTGGDVLNPKSWVKKSKPVFARTDEVFGPGHCAFVKSPDGKEDWIIYHAHIAKGVPQRDIRIQRFTWNADGSPNFGRPISPKTSLPVPTGEN